MNSLDNQFNVYPGGYSSVPISNSRMHLAFCDSELNAQLRSLINCKVTWLKCYAQEAILANGGEGNKDAKRAIVQKILSTNENIANLIESKLRNGQGKQLIGFYKDFTADIIRVIESLAVGSGIQKLIILGNLRSHSRRITRHLNAVNQRFMPFHEIEPVWNEMVESLVASFETRKTGNYIQEIKHFSDTVNFANRLADLLTSAINKALENPSSVR